MRTKLTKVLFTKSKVKFSSIKLPRLPICIKSGRAELKEEYWNFIKNTIPTIHLVVTNRCNIFCKICYANSYQFDFRYDIPMKDILQILKKIGKGKRVILIGGEPTVRKDIFEIIKAIKKSGNIPELFTNGIKLANIEFVKKLKEAGLRKVYLSFDGFEEEIYEKLNYNKKLLLLKILALKNLETFEIPIVISMRVMKSINEDQVKNVIEFVVNSIKNKKPIKGILFYGATPGGRFLIPEATITSKEVFQLINKVCGKKVASKSYFLETKRLALNIFKLTSRVGKPILLGISGYYGIFYAGSIKKLLPTSFLKRLNEYLSKGKMFLFFINVIRNRILRNVVLKALFMRSILDAILSLPNVFYIGFGNLTTDIVWENKIRDNISIEKDILSNKLYIRTSGDVNLYQE